MSQDKKLTLYNFEYHSCANLVPRSSYGCSLREWKVRRRGEEKRKLLLWHREKQNIRSRSRVHRDVSRETHTHRGSLSRWEIKFSRKIKPLIRIHSEIIFCEKSFWRETNIPTMKQDEHPVAATLIVGVDGSLRDTRCARVRSSGYEE